MKVSSQGYPVIDLFAGAGGLGEGFATSTNSAGHRHFHVAASIEKDSTACKTLRLRHFFRAFTFGQAPDKYYEAASNAITIQDLFESFPVESDLAERSVLCATLGDYPRLEIRQFIKERLKRAKAWVLVGGPPCQAYSIAGRSRMRGMPGFGSDERHFLYREYLRIIADHEPPVFVLENVKGLASATVNGKSTLRRILDDLVNPSRALRRKDGTNPDYSLHGIGKARGLFNEFCDRILIRAEEHGVPQARHRIFVIGVRNDIELDKDCFVLDYRQPPTVEDMIGSLPKIRSGVTQGEDSFERWKKALATLHKVKYDNAAVRSSVRRTIKAELQMALRNLEASLGRNSTRYPVYSTGPCEVLKYVTDDRLGTLPDHHARSHMPSDLCRYMFAATYAHITGRSPRLNEFPQSLLPKHSNVIHNLNNKRGGGRFCCVC